MAVPVDDRDRRRIGEADMVRQADELMGADAAELCQATMGRLAHQSAFDPVGRIDQHPVADLPAVHARADLHDLAGDVETHDHRH